MTRILILFFFIITLPVLAQTDLINSSLTKPQLNILYVGVDNIIEVASEKIDEGYKIVSSTGKVNKLTSNKFIIKLVSIKNDTLRLYKGNKLILSKAFEVRTIGDPIAQFGNIKDSLAYIQEILSYTKLNVIIPNCYISSGLYIRSFNLRISNKHGSDIVNFGKVSGNEVSYDFKNNVSKLKKGDKIIFTEIKATCPDCIAIILKDLVITVK